MVRGRKPLIRREERRRMRRERWKRWALVLAVAVGVIWGFMRGIPGYRWDEAEIEQLSIDLRPEQVAQLRTDLDATLAEAQAQWEREGELSDAELQQVEAALDQQRSLILALRNSAYNEIQGSNVSGQLVLSEDRDRVRALEKVRDLGRGEALAAHSKKAEHEARALYAAGEAEAAYKKLEQARDLQVDLNALYPNSPHVDEPRTESLRLQLQRWELEPQMRRLQELRERANVALAAEHYEEALSLFENALSYQRRLNRQQERLPQDSVRQERELEVQVADLQARDQKLKLEQIVADAEQAVIDGNGSRGMSLYREAADIQKQLTREFPDSTYSSTQRVHELEAAAYGAQVRPEVEQLEAQLKGIRRRLAAGQAEQVAGEISQAYRLLRRTEELPEAQQYLPEALTVEASLLYRLRQDLAAIQAWAAPRLQPLPDEEGASMLDREVHQSLYEQVMEANPSAQKGMALPVESVTFTEAQEFARRLGWILGRNGRLPREQEFRNAVGEPGSDEIQRITWSSASPGIDPQKALPQGPAELHANTSGFYDLLGNVSEWVVASEPEAGSQAVAGGTLRDNPIRLRSVPVEPRNVNERNPFTGFRVVIETAEATPEDGSGN